MPEIAEVITVINDLKKEILDLQIKDITILDKKYSFDSEKILNTQIVSIYNLGKLIIIELSNDSAIAIHLAMTGLLQFNHQDKYTKILLHFSNHTYLSFSDIRKFGYFKIFNKNELQNYRNDLGTNVLDIEILNFSTLLKTRKTPIHTTLLNQKIISGIGNVYATDALFLSKIRPETIANLLEKKQLEILYRSLKLIINEGIKNKGISMKRFVDIYGKKGTQQNHFRVYSKKDHPCPECKTKITSIKLNGRTVYYCKNCQR